MPPRGLSFVGHGDFAQVGHEFAGFFKELGGLRPGDRVLDLGCGIGRMALPLTGYLEDGSYAGFDVGRAMIRWCRRHITPRHPNFEFSWAPVYNGKYNPFGTISASEFRFPYEDSSFDFAFATSLFTHLLDDDMRHYVAETSRVLKPGGTCFFTFFLLTPEAEREIAEGRAMPFVHPVDGGAVVDPREPELGVAYPLEEVRSVLADAGLELREPVHAGLWANAPGGLTLQDVVIARRAA
jgi:SAM-dependent methyltransferase